ncbi:MULTISPECIES: beta-ketoacyl-ACP synthase II [Streptomyces]|uniref:3-oxoacyl-[acyl-carrier-protein] synthase 2 n=1 Tax=Streptomyces amritsarensis TaxID=681158 RepID=A0ABX3FVC3_9ACTN|nr:MULTISPECIES: beta-ketoacyl-ACP synthase II [Streptomyces]AQT74959.1 beta-ketoacyl-[acyl-carrier-protein] synthase II [Streptomyces sp. fd1-xmd]MDX6759599.1 beta-ketoacyl-ACP synthase II [Streptomyces sp. F8]OLZ57482.1 beta-ketoacyl-[acyl-carrier-protein] synthase II [Streptomyces amritsarensis]
MPNPSDSGVGRRRVVITGAGVVTALGNTVEDLWAALVAGRSGIGPITRFDASDLPTRIAAEVVDFDPLEYMSRRESRRMDHFGRYAVAASVQAMKQSGLEMPEGTGHRLGVLIGSGYGANIAGIAAVEQMLERGPKSINSNYAIGGAPDNPSGEVAMRYGAEGPTGAIITACATGATCVGEAVHMIRAGRVDAVIAGGADDPISRLDVAAMANLRALTRRNDEPHRASRPFDRARDGFVFGAGAGIVVVEELEHALRRGAPILAEIVGYGATTDAYHSTAPHPEGLGARRALTAALEDGGLRPEDVDYINAHGTSTVLNDRTEVETIRAVFGDHATRIPISSIKSMIGHLIAGAGTVELIATMQAMAHGIVPPTLNCDDPEDTELNFVPNRAQEHTVRTAISNSFGFGGHNAVLAVRRWEG